MELISRAIRSGASDSGQPRGSPSQKGDQSDTLDAAEGVRDFSSGEEASTSKPERGAGASAADRPALELDDDDDAGEPRDRQKRQRRSLQEIAEEAGVPLKRIYDAQVDTGIEGEEPVTVGTLKDHYRQTRDFQTQKDEFDHQQDTMQTEILAARSQVQGIADRLASIVGQETFQRILGDVQTDQRKVVEQSKKQLLEWYPQWTDVNVMQRDRERIERALGSYGWSKHDVASIADARIVKFIMDSVKLRERYDRLKAGSVERQPTTQPASTKKHRPSTFDEARTIADRGDPKAAVRKLLEGG
jgi:hypothetical protein